MSRRKRRRARGDITDGEDLNPMNYVSNLSDVMLVLAVGLMVALLLHWNVKINSASDIEETQQETEAGDNDSISFDGDDLENVNETLPENLEKMGDVYYDPDTGRYYIVGDSENGS